LSDAEPYALLAESDSIGVPLRKSLEQRSAGILRLHSRTL